MRVQVRSAVPLPDDQQEHLMQHLRATFQKEPILEAQTDPDLSLSERIRKLQQAQLTFERARELIKYMPVEVNVEEQNNEVNRLLGEIAEWIKANAPRQSS